MIYSFSRVISNLELSLSFLYYYNQEMQTGLPELHIVVSHVHSVDIFSVPKSWTGEHEKVEGF